MPGVPLDLTSGQAPGADVATVSDPVRTAYIKGADPRTAPRTMLKWGANLAETLEEVPVIIVVGWDRSGFPYSTDGIFKTFTDETVYTGVMPAVQNLMLAARGLGLGTCLTTVANIYERQDERAPRRPAAGSAGGLAAARVSVRAVHTQEAHPDRREAPSRPLVAAEPGEPPGVEDG